MKKRMILARISILAFCLVLMLFLPMSGTKRTQAADGVTVSGIVMNIVTGQPEANIVVRMYYGGGWPYYETISLSNGTFTYSDIPSGNYLILPYPSADYVGVGDFYYVGTTDVSGIYLKLIKNIALYSPAQNADIETPNPVLYWEAAPHAVSYSVFISRVIDNALIENAMTPTNNYTISVTLEDGVSYEWEIRARDSNGALVGLSTPAFTFTYHSGPKSVEVNTEGETTLVSWDGTISFTFPEMVIMPPATITYQRETGATGNFLLLGANKYYSISSTSPLIEGGSYLVKISFTDRDILGIDPDTLGLYYWDNDTGQWVKEPTSILNLENHEIIATPNHFSKWGVLGETHPIFLPMIRK